MRRLVVTLLVSLAVVFGSASTAHAYDTLSETRQGVVGHTAKNFHTHVWTSISGTYVYQRWVHVRGVGWRKKDFVGVRISAQHCRRSGCWGRVLGGKLRPKHLWGRTRPPTSRTGTRGSAVALEGTQNYCYSGLQCAAPWYWINVRISEFDKNVHDKVAKPCVDGALAGVGVKVSHSAAAGLMVEDGAAATAKKAAGIFGPDGYGVLALGGCFFSVGKNGVSGIKKIVSSLNPFDKAVR